MAQEKNKALNNLSDMPTAELSSTLSEHEAKLEALASRLTNGTFLGLDEIKDPEFDELSAAMTKLIDEFVSRCQQLADEMQDDGLEVFLVEDDGSQFFITPGETPEKLKNSGFPFFRRDVLRFDDEAKKPVTEGYTFFGLSSYMFQMLGIGPLELLGAERPSVANEKVTLH